MMKRQSTNVGQRVVTAVVPMVVARALVPMTVAGLMVGGCGDPAAVVPAASEERVSAPLPAGYALQLDRANRDRVNFAVQIDNGDLIVDTGPAGILYRPDDTDHVVGVAEAHRYTVHGRFTEIGAPMGHREGFGLFIGGQQLGAESQRYVYFMVRGDGRYLVKRRDGDATIELSDGWQPSHAVQVPTGDGGEVTNELVVEVEGRGLRLLCNGEPLADVVVGDMDTHGVAGIRVNHNLHVRVGDFGLDR